MSVCAEILNGLNLACETGFVKKYYQQIVLINKVDVDDFVINSNVSENNINFFLKSQKTGFLFIGSEIGNSFSASFTKSEERGIVYYTSKLTLPVMGVDESSKSILKQLDFSRYFAAIQFKDGTVEIHGFPYGLKTEGYTYEPQPTGGGNITLVSRFPEYQPPFIYKCTRLGCENKDFNNLFSNNTEIIRGDFNDDFNNDFYNN